jgi:hypothetical protein
VATTDPARVAETHGGETDGTVVSGMTTAGITEVAKEAGVVGTAQVNK